MRRAIVLGCRPASPGSGRSAAPNRAVMSRDFPLRLLLSILIALLLAACSPTTAPPLADHRQLGELRVATRHDAISYRKDGDGEVRGFEYELLLALGERLGVPVRFDTYPDATRALDAVIQGRAHLAAAGLGRNDRLPVRWSAALREVDYVIAARGDGTPIRNEGDLAGRTVSAQRGSLAAQHATDIRRRVPGLNVHFPVRDGEEDLLARLAAGELDLVATDRLHYAFAARLHPDIDIAWELPTPSTISWATSLRDSALATEVDTFIDEAKKSGMLARVADRHFGHIRRLRDADIKGFLDRVGERLPRYRPHFEEAEARTGIDWRYLAAVAYQESQWDPNATSFTGVRGMMMLTSETADRLGVANRLDARESILGGARYLAMLEDDLPAEVPEPDRSWMAAAAYNLGMGHFNGARAIARSLGKDEHAWYDMKGVLPLLSRPQYAARLKSGPARGGEAVMMAENVRSYYDILLRLEPPHAAPLTVPGLRLGRRDAGPGE